MEGLPPTWTMNTISPIHKAGDTMDPGNYRTIMIGHILAKLYGSVTRYLRQSSTLWRRGGVFEPLDRRVFGGITLHSTISSPSGVSSSRRRLMADVCTAALWTSAKPSTRYRGTASYSGLQILGVPSDMIWGIIALYEQVVGRVRCPGGLSEEVTSTIGVKQGCPLSPTLFGLYVDEISDFIDRGGGRGTSLSGFLIALLLYADDLILLADTQEGLQRHMDALGDFCTQRGLTVNLSKTKVMVFHTSRRVMRDTVVTFRGSPVEVTSSYVYLGVTFSSTGGRFSMRQAARDRLTRGYASLALLERQCHQSHFQEPRTKGWLFDTMVTPAMMYASPVWAPGLSSADWQRIERPLVLMLSWMIRDKPSVPHTVIRAEFAASPMVVEALFQTITFIQRVRDMTPGRLPRLAMESSQMIASQGTTHPCWYATVLAWFTTHGIDIDRLPPSQYDPASPYYRLSRVDRNRVLRCDLVQAHVRDTWMVAALPTKMQHYRDHFLRLTEDGFIQRPGYMDIFMSHAMRVAIGQLRVSSHTLEIEAGRAGGIPREARLCRLCRGEVESEEHYICRCPVFYEIRGRYHCLFRDGFGPLSRVIDYPDQRCLGLFLLEIRRHREDLLRAQTPRARPA